MQDVVYLKNGSIIHGTITEQVPDESLTIETKDGDVFVYKMSEIKKIKKEKVKEDEPEGSACVRQDAGQQPGEDFALTVNPLGFLQFGPQVDFEIKTAPSLFVVASLRWHGAGMLSYAISPHTRPGRVRVRRRHKVFCKAAGDTRRAVFRGIPPVRAGPPVGHSITGAHGRKVPHT